MKALLWAVGFGLASVAVAAPPPGAAPDGTPATSPQADVAWAKIGADAQQLTDAEKAHDLEALRKVVPQIQTDSQGFIKQFATDPRLPGARLMKAQSDRIALGLQLPNAPAKEEVAAEFKSLATDPVLPDEIRVQAALVDASQIFRKVIEAAEANPHDPAIWSDLEATITAFEKSVGPGPGQEPVQAAVMLRHNQIMLLDKMGEQDQLKPLLARLEQSPEPAMAAMAHEEQTKLDQAAALKSTPLDLHFTALDGSAVDLAKLRGKVVLLDFWATWCPPCRAETPDVVAAYQKYHAKGFEIVGISLDQDQGALTKYIADNKMPWPQYFDGKGWDNDLAKRFGIDSIPAMWLIGKNGVVVTQDGRDDLDGQVAKLLGGP